MTHSLSLSLFCSLSPMFTKSLFCPVFSQQHYCGIERPLNSNITVHQRVKEKPKQKQNESMQNRRDIQRGGKRRIEKGWKQVNEQIYSFIFANPTNLLENYVIFVYKRYSCVCVVCVCVCLYCMVPTPVYIRFARQRNIESLSTTVSMCVYLFSISFSNIKACVSYAREYVWWWLGRKKSTCKTLDDAKRKNR